MTDVNFADRYNTGEVLRLVGGENQTVTHGVVLNFDPVTAEHRALINGKPQPQGNNHWHVAIHEPETDEWLPAAIWQGLSARGDGGINPHISRRHTSREELNEVIVSLGGDPNYVAYNAENMLCRVRAILEQTVRLETTKT